MPDLLKKSPVGVESPNGLRHFFHIIDGREKSGFTVMHDLGGPGRARGNRNTALRHGFKHGNAAAFGIRHKKTDVSLPPHGFQLIRQHHIIKRHAALEIGREVGDLLPKPVLVTTLTDDSKMEVHAQRIQFPGQGNEIRHTLFVIRDPARIRQPGAGRAGARDRFRDCLPEGHHVLPAHAGFVQV